MSLAHFEVKALPNGTGSVVVDDQDLSSQVAGVQFQARLGEVPVLTLFEQVEGSISGDGIVRVMSQTMSPGEEIAAFLDAIDPQELERVVLEQCGMGDSGMALALEVLKRWACGKP